MDRSALRPSPRQGGPAGSCARACTTRPALPRSPFRWR
jgi:hypothetical protein